MAKVGKKFAKVRESVVEASASLRVLKVPGDYVLCAGTADIVFASFLYWDGGRLTFLNETQRPLDERAS